MLFIKECIAGEKLHKMIKKSVFRWMLLAVWLMIIIPCEQILMPINTVKSVSPGLNTLQLKNIFNNAFEKEDFHDV